MAKPQGSRPGTARLGARWSRGEPSDGSSRRATQAVDALARGQPGRAAPPAGGGRGRQDRARPGDQGRRDHRPGRARRAVGAGGRSRRRSARKARGDEPSRYARTGARTAAASGRRDARCATGTSSFVYDPATDDLSWLDERSCCRGCGAGVKVVYRDLWETALMAALRGRAGPRSVAPSRGWSSRRRERAMRRDVFSR